MTSSMTARRAPAPFSPAQPSDEGYLNKSLLDNIDAQGDAEPMSSDSEAAGASAPFGSLPTVSSVGSPSIPYRISMQSPLVPPRPDSPTHHALASHLKSPQHQHSTDLFTTGSQNNTTHSMYNNMNGIGLPAPDYSEPDVPNYSPLNGGYASGPFRTSSSFSFPRSRHPNTFRDTSSAFPSAYPSNETFGPSQMQMSGLPAPLLQQGIPNHIDSHSGRTFDFPANKPLINGGHSSKAPTQAKSLFTNVDPFRQNLETPIILQKQQSNAGVAPSLLQNGHQGSFQPPYTNGLGSHNVAHGHPAFGGPLAGNGAGPGQTAGPGAASAPSMNHTNGPAPGSQAQEEISTIFVVGFPDDMSEREFQNMFTFSSGFEAATLKIPNKESTSYGAVNGQPGRSGLLMSFSGNDPYNLVTMNQGGVLIDGGRDGPMTAWSASGPQEDGHFMQNNMPMQPPRKQIIGFAKFRTRDQALEARDVLQGRRVDVEKGAVLKAEMAKKNLHTKRGPGVIPPFPGGVPGASGTEGLMSLPSLPTAGEALTQRDKQLGALGAMGIDLSGFQPRRDRSYEGRDEDASDRRRAEFPPGINAFGTRGPRERAEEDERERERKRKEKEKEATRLRQNSYAFEAFHSVPQQMVRQGANSLLSAENGCITPNGFTSPPQLQSPPSHHEPLSAQWGNNLRDVSAAAQLRKMGVPQHPLTGLPPRPLSPTAASPPTTLESGASPSVPASGCLSTQFPTPESTQSSLPSHPSLPSRPRPRSPSSDTQSSSMSSLPSSQPPSVNGSQSGLEDDLSQSIGALAVSTESGATSPQLPSPASGTSSGGGRNGADQNPPINTLYVGNLPTSTSPGGTSHRLLESQLREFFSTKPGFRNLCFRQKSNSPMCFVEFEDVAHATRALYTLSGDTLGGLVRNGGIRLSYSKNPLGVRTPGSGGNGSSLQQQQQCLSRDHDGVLDPVFPGEGFRHADAADTIRGMRRDMSGMTSPTSSYHYTSSPPPPRFFSPPPPSGTFGGGLTTSTSFPRANPQSFGFAAGTTSFSPFGIPQCSIPDQPSADASNTHIAHPLSPPAAAI
ncbi:uncharacterized protein BXZ73DRAFT_43924 [Epithele typhae]|uniref:uncharacterized protein n=1 Tax=Epithele typhae TaxID=378194 RepID=UPI002007D456|nr:uncharacterized protein BXZ73DRAFT_43924 [Epithele typhae]KAH9939249.1 hypothetical protein BXZ73DRAFT_43924 [Epithele typhae]